MLLSIALVLLLGLAAGLELGDGPITCSRHPECYKTRESVEDHEGSRDGLVQFGNCSTFKTMTIKILVEHNNWVCIMKLQITRISCDFLRERSI